MNRLHDVISAIPSESDLDISSSSDHATVHASIAGSCFTVAPPRPRRDGKRAPVRCLSKTVKTRKRVCPEAKVGGSSQVKRLCVSRTRVNRTALQYMMRRTFLECVSAELDFCLFSLSQLLSCLTQRKNDTVDILNPIGMME